MPSLPQDVKAAVQATRLAQPLQVLIAHSQLIKQGAEAKVYKSTLYPSPTITSPDGSSTPSTLPPAAVPLLLKHRFPKQYRHPTLDALLTRQRLTSEARALVRCLKAGVKVPALRVIDVREGVVGMEWVDGWSVREVLGGGQEEDQGLVEEEEEDVAELAEEVDIGELLKEKGVEEDAMLAAIGAEIGKMHLAEIIHGDLTTSNMMVRLLPPSSPSPFEVVIIDFGLSSASPMPEDRAVDLYVLERAFSSTHPVHPNTRPHFERVLDGYARVVKERGKKGEWERVEKRLEEVRMRGRKRSMVG
ncbi:SPOSA6832_00066 [Sporobolomyces salmonicolor]|uniref:non-specific serine/threonine protein kinase n=1 Tax=Sporidiobolus salmonicolor TaxID=5005 RepID=A0A0D6EFD7_SPOSA|nr:SPOSA6832_00066 [Sporobolomyces salmonicolor]